jgi:hypothetical protein
LLIACTSLGESLATKWFGGACELKVQIAQPVLGSVSNSERESLMASRVGRVCPRSAGLTRLHGHLDSSDHHLPHLVSVRPVPLTTTMARWQRHGAPVPASVNSAIGSRLPLPAPVDLRGSRRPRER